MMIQNQELKLNYSYDMQNDAIYIKTLDNSAYNQSIEFEFGIIMDFDIDGRPVALEILDLIQLFDIDTNSLKSIENISMKIKMVLHFIGFENGFIDGK